MIGKKKVNMSVILHYLFQDALPLMNKFANCTLLDCGNYVVILKFDFRIFEYSSGFKFQGRLVGLGSKIASVACFFFFLIFWGNSF